MRRSCEGHQGERKQSMVRGDDTVVLRDVLDIKKDTFGQPIHLELCKICDANQPAAAALIRFFTEGGGVSI
ncbi:MULTISPECIES: DUF6300 family protein [unclassified Streptomyces]|uniref:DUF6300 family protein n=2 Tax=Streptomyces TaxID=1883 RepID=UPI0038653720